jgi:hypothetical protein
MPFFHVRLIYGMLDYSKNLKYLKKPRPKFSGISKFFTFTHEYVHCYQEKRFIRDRSHVGAFLSTSSM